MLVLFLFTVAQVVAVSAVNDVLWCCSGSRVINCINLNQHNCEYHNPQCVWGAFKSCPSTPKKRVVLLPSKISVNMVDSIYPGLDDDTISVLQQTQKQKQTGISKQKRQTNPLRPLVGSNYFSGWWQGEGNKWIDSPVHNTSWLTQYPNRQPLLGQYNNQSTMDKEILSASSHGIDFFQMLWYNIYNQSDQTGYRTDLSPGSQYLNTGVQT